jgi:MFS family permease
MNPMTPQERHNALCNVTGESLWGFQVAMILPATVLTVLLTQLGASKVAIGVIPSLEGLGMFMSVFGIYFFRSHKKRQARIILFHYIVLVPCLAAMGLAVLAHDFLSREALRVLLLLGWALFMSGVGMIGPVWMDWIAHLFRREIRGTVTGLSWGCSNLAGIAGALAAGWALGAHPEVLTFGWLYLAAALFATSSISVFLLVRDPARDLAEDRAPGWREFVAATGESLSDRPFRYVLIGRSLGLAGFCVGPFIALHYLSAEGGALTGSLVVTLGAAQTVGAAVSAMVFGRVGDRIGHRFGLLMGIVFQIGSLLCVILAPGAFLISYLNLVVESCPHEVRSAHIMVGNMVVGVAGLLIPLAGAALAEQAGIPALMKASLGISLVALAWNLLKVRDPRDLSRSPT